MSPHASADLFVSAGYYQMSIALVVVSAFIVCTLAW
jgi:hypothetical protein